MFYKQRRKTDCTKKEDSRPPFFIRHEGKPPVIQKISLPPHPRRSLSRHRLAAAHLQIDGTLHVDVGGRWITYTPTHTPQVSLRGHQTAKHCWTSTRSALRTNTCGLRTAYLPNGAGAPTGRGTPQVSLRGHQTAKHCWTSTRSALRTFTWGLRPAYLPNGAGTPTGSNIA